MSEPETADSEADNNKELKKIVSKWKKAARAVSAQAAADREAFTLEKATLEETISAWMTRALYAEKHVRALETALEGAQRNNGELSPTKKVHDIDSSTGVKRGNANGVTPLKKKSKVEVEELPDDDPVLESDDDDSASDVSEKGKEPEDPAAKKKARNMRLTKKRLFDIAKGPAQAFLQQSWLEKKESFESKSSETFREYQLWCDHHNVAATMKHRRFNKFMSEFMPNGYTVGRGSANRAVVSFNYELAAEDVANNMKAAEEQAKNAKVAAAEKRKKNKKE